MRDDDILPAPATVDRRFHTRSGHVVLHRTNVEHLAKIIRRREAMLIEAFQII